MALEISFGLPQFAHCLRTAIEQVWQQGWRTEDLAEAGCQTVGTQAFAELIAEMITTTAAPAVGRP